MPRPPRCRRICVLPQVDAFSPDGRADTEPVLLALDEYEVIRLVDFHLMHNSCIWFDTEYGLGKLDCTDILMLAFKLTRQRMANSVSGASRL